MMSFSLHFVLNFVNSGNSAGKRLAAKRTQLFCGVFLSSVMNRTAAMKDPPGGAHWNYVHRRVFYVFVIWLDCCTYIIQMICSLM